MKHEHYSYWLLPMGILFVKGTHFLATRNDYVEISIKNKTHDYINNF